MGQKQCQIQKHKGMSLKEIISSWLLHTKKKKKIPRDIGSKTEKKDMSQIMKVIEFNKQ